MLIKEGSKILFQGDSITDCGRSRDSDAYLGSGYAAMVAAALKIKYPQLKLEFINRGISGNRAKDLNARWQQDCIDLKPDIVSILIGINDTWRRYDSNNETPAPEYEANYRNILSQTKDIGAKIIMIEPFLLESLPDRSEWRVDLDPKIQVARKLAREFADCFIPMDGIFAAASINYPMAELLPDGVHPSQIGHALISREYIKAIEQA